MHPCNVVILTNSTCFSLKQPTDPEPTKAMKFTLTTTIVALCRHYSDINYNSPLHGPLR